MVGKRAISPPLCVAAARVAPRALQQPTVERRRRGHALHGRLAARRGRLRGGGGGGVAAALGSVTAADGVLLAAAAAYAMCKVRLSSFVAVHPAARLAAGRLQTQAGFSAVLAAATLLSAARLLH